MPELPKDEYLSDFLEFRARAGMTYFLGFLLEVPPYFDAERGAH
jgi:hypothetical protein